MSFTHHRLVNPSLHSSSSTFQLISAERAGADSYFSDLVWKVTAESLGFKVFLLSSALQLIVLFMLASFLSWGMTLKVIWHRKTLQIRLTLNHYTFICSPSFSYNTRIHKFTKYSINTVQNAIIWFFFHPSCCWSTLLTEQSRMIFEKTEMPSEGVLRSVFIFNELSRKRCLHSSDNIKTKQWPTI